MQGSKMELLSPAGSYESLIAGIKAGTDSVYFGVEQLNMRTRSSHNFTLTDLPKISEICKEHKIKSYLTLNTILFDHDISLMKKIVDEVKIHKIDAVIASDHSVMNYAKKAGVNIHISTQSNITNLDTIEFYSAFADVIVLARELSLSQVASIISSIKRKKIKGPTGNLIKIEIFGHGALCMAVSGKCYMSLHSDYASANRGACIQNCRKSYIVTDKEDGVEFEVDNEYIMSAKDLCTIDFLDKIKETGVDILKIEGRGRSAEYVYTVTKCYREAIDSLENKTFNSGKITEWKEQLSTVYNRGFWEGYYLGKTMGEWSNTYGSVATKRKIYIGKGLKYFEEAKIGEFLIESQSLSLGDEIVITGPTTGVIQTEIGEIWVDDFKKDKVGKGEKFTMKMPEKIRPSDKLYKLVPA